MRDAFEEERIAYPQWLGWRTDSSTKPARKTRLEKGIGGVATSVLFSSVLKKKGSGSRILVSISILRLFN